MSMSLEERKAHLDKMVYLDPETQNVGLVESATRLFCEKMLQKITLKELIFKYCAIHVSIVKLNLHVPARDAPISIQNIEIRTKLPNCSQNQDQYFSFMLVIHSYDVTLLCLLL